MYPFKVFQFQYPGEEHFQYKSLSLSINEWWLIENNYIALITQTYKSKYSISFTSYALSCFYIVSLNNHQIIIKHSELVMSFLGSTSQQIYSSSQPNFSLPLSPYTNNCTPNICNAIEANIDWQFKLHGSHFLKTDRFASDKKISKMLC